MSFKTILMYGSMSVLLIYPLLVTADRPNSSLANELIIQSDKIVYNPDKLTFDSIKEYEKRFTFDWNDPQTLASNKQKITDLASNKQKITEIESFLDKMTSKTFSKLNSDDQQALGKIAYKLGNYYNYIMLRPDLAIAKMNLAATLLINKKDKAWNYANLAYAYKQKYAKSKQIFDTNKAIYYSDKVITELYHNATTKEVAFAYYIKGLTQYDTSNYDEAVQNLKQSVAIYEKLADTKETNYLQVKNKLTDAILDNEVAILYNQFNQYWLASKLYYHSYVTKCLLAANRLYLPLDELTHTRNNFMKLIMIKQHLDGDQSGWQIQLYSSPGQGNVAKINMPPLKQKIAVLKIIQQGMHS